MKSEPGFLWQAITRFGLNAASLSLSQIVKRSFRVVVLLIVGRLLGPGLFGQYVLLLTVVEMVAVISGAGYIDLLARDVAREPAWAGRLLVRLTGLRMFFIPVASGFLLLILWVLRYGPGVIISVVLLLLSLFPRSINENCQGILRGRSQFARLVWIEAVQGAVLIALIFLMLVVAHLGLRGAIYAEVLSATCGSVVALAISTEFLRKAECSASLPPIRSAFAFNLFPLIVNVYDRADVLILSKLAGDFAVGIYGLPYRLYTMLQILPYGLMGALLPGFSRSTWDAQSKVRCGRILQALYAAALVAVLALWFIIPSILVFLLGPKFRLSEVALRILAWAVIPMFLNLGLNTVLLASRHEKVFIRTASVCTVVNVVANILLVPRFSFVAAAVVTVLTECVLLGQNMLLVRRITGTIPVPSVVLPSTLCFAAALTFGLALQHIIPQVLAGIFAVCTFAFISYKHLSAMRVSVASVPG